MRDYTQYLRNIRRYFHLTIINLFLSEIGTQQLNDRP
jgi:hypothetical protein